MAAVSYFEIVPACHDGLDHVMSHLWERGEEELRRLGLTHKQARDRFASYIERGTTSGIVLADGVPVLATGICADDDEHFTWFQATDEFDAHALHITRRMRRAVREHDGELHLYSTLVHRDAERWYGALGFARDGWCTLTAARWPLFRYTRS